MHILCELVHNTYVCFVIPYKFSVDVCADMTSLRTPNKRVTYPDTFAAPDQTRAQFDASYDLDPREREAAGLSHGLSIQSPHGTYTGVL